ncbi:MAG TPA: hypothetical protein DCM05_10215 [Elusimicrobia bacterium]|nr:hypothetical protein [Elusimicrobiota bacterium]
MKNRYSFPLLLSVLALSHQTAYATAVQVQTPASAAGLAPAQVGGALTLPVLPGSSFSRFSAPASGPSILPAMAAAPVPSRAPDFGALTGAVTRTLADPGPVKKLWFVFEDKTQLERSGDMLRRVAEENPGVEIVTYQEKALLPQAKGEDGKESPDTGKDALTSLVERMQAEKAECVLTSNQELYEVFRRMRDFELARDVPFGFVGRRHVSVDIPRASLNPLVLSDPLKLPYRRYLDVGAGGGVPEPIDTADGTMEGSRMALAQLLETAHASGHGAAKKDEDMGLLMRLGTKALMRLSGQADDRTTAKLRKKAHALAAYIEENGIDALSTDDPETAAVVGLMKRMGYHKSLPVVWKARQAPPDASGINVALRGGGWLEEAPHVALARPEGEGRAASVREALSQATRLERLPDNFMEMGGVSVRNFEPKVAEAVRRAVPPSPKGRYDVHFLMTNGNGVKSKGDANAFGHFGMAVTDENGKILVWTVQYNDGGSFTGGLGDGRQMTLAEYLYGLWYLPGAAGQAIPLAETAVSPVLDFIWKGAVDAAGLSAMRRVAAAINAKHLQGEDNYSFTNRDGQTNCISLVTQILRAAGFPIAESGIQAPADKAVEFIAGLSRSLLSNQIGPLDFGLIRFERPAHAGPEHYRIPNTALGSPLFNRSKPWSRMNLWEKLVRAIASVPNFIRSLAIPSRIEAFTAMASQSVRVGPNSRELVVEDHSDSPIVQLRGAAETVLRLREERVPLERELAALNEELLERGPAAADERLEELRRRHKELELRLALSILDEQIAQRSVDYLKLRIADTTGRRAGRFDEVKAAREEVLALRDLMEAEGRILDEGEIARLDALNAQVERRLQRIRLDLLREAGPAVPHDMKQISRQVTLKVIDDLLDKAGKGKGDGKGKS